MVFSYPLTQTPVYLFSLFPAIPHTLHLHIHCVVAVLSCLHPQSTRVLSHLHAFFQAVTSASNFPFCFQKFLPNMFIDYQLYAKYHFTTKNYPKSIDC